MAEMGLVIGLLYWLPRLPELTLAGAPALAGLVAWLELPGAGPTAMAANLSVLVALAFGWAAALERLAARRRQRAVWERTAELRHPLPPGPASSMRRGTVPITTGLLLIAVAGFAVVQAVDATSADQHRADDATRTGARVLSRGEDSVRVRTEDGRRLTLSASYPEDYRRGATVTVLEDGTWRRLAAEPYDAFAWQLLFLATGLPGGSMLVTGLLARRRATALRHVPLPVMRVRERSDDTGRTWLYAGDEDTGRAPLCNGRFTAHRPDTEEPEAVHDDGDDADEDEPFTIDTRLHEAVMFGAPYEGGELVLATTDRDGRPVVVHTVGPITLPRPGKGPALSTEETDTAPGIPRGQTPSTTDAVPAGMVPARQPLRWGPGVLARAGGAAWALCLVAAFAWLVHQLMIEGFGWKVLLLPGPLALAGPAANQLNWRVTADRSGLWLTGPWRVRHIPWEKLRAVRYTTDGDVRITLHDGSVRELTDLGWPSLERRFHLRPSHVHMIEAVTALQAHPQLRPTEPASPRDRGHPLGPVLIAFAVLTVASWLLG
ncbi:hypothetical protein ABZT08_03300 [Streptomyces sp. NPDC005526]|uniref:hypothetical protein n=1 Tax=Streptomyces sp. NPDC005526 TaxID=3156885 RepID=UPI0033B396C3